MSIVRPDATLRYNGFMKQVETAIKQYLDERDWNDLRPSDIAKSISIEAAELLELFQWSDKTIAQVKSDEALLEELKRNSQTCLFMPLIWQFYSILIQKESFSISSLRYEKISGGSHEG